MFPGEEAHGLDGPWCARNVRLFEGEKDSLFVGRPRKRYWTPNVWTNFPSRLAVSRSRVDSINSQHIEARILMYSYV